MSNNILGGKHQMLLVYACSASAMVNAAGVATSTKLMALPMSLSASVSVITYLANFMLTDLTNEIYGKKYATLLKRISLASIIVTIGITQTGADHGETGSFDRLAVATCDVKCSDQER